VPVPNGYADFSGVQLDDLRVGATYTLNFSSLISSVFSLYLTDSGLPQSTFDTINRDTLILATPEDKFISYSYDTINWIPVSQPFGVYNRSDIKDIQWNGSKWLAAGILGPEEANALIGSSNPDIKFNMPILDGTPYSVAWNGKSGSNSLYVMIGDALENVDTTEGSISKSTDGINWSASYTPISTNLTKTVLYSTVSSDGNNSNGYIAWNGTYFIASGYTVTYQTLTSSEVPIVSGMMYSTDGVRWTLVTNYIYYNSNPQVKSIYPLSRGTTVVGNVTYNLSTTTFKLGVKSAVPTNTLEVGTRIYGGDIPGNGAVITEILENNAPIITATIGTRTAALSIGTTLTIQSLGDIEPSDLVGKSFVYNNQTITIDSIDNPDPPYTYTVSIPLLISPAAQIILNFPITAIIINNTLTISELNGVSPTDLLNKSLIYNNGTINIINGIDTTNLPYRYNVSKPLTISTPTIFRIFFAVVNGTSLGTTLTIPILVGIQAGDVVGKSFIYNNQTINITAGIQTTTAPYTYRISTSLTVSDPTEFTLTIPITGTIVNDILIIPSLVGILSTELTGKSFVYIDQTVSIGNELPRIDSSYRYEITKSLLINTPTIFGLFFADVTGTIGTTGFVYLPSTTLTVTAFFGLDSINSLLNREFFYNNKRIKIISQPQEIVGSNPTAYEFTIDTQESRPVSAQAITLINPYINLYKIEGTINFSNLSLLDETMVDFPQLVSVIVKKIVWNGLSGAASLTVAVGSWRFSDNKIFGIASSSDGINWTIRGPELIAADPTPILDVCWTGYIWIAIGRFSDYGEITASTDAINWTDPVLPSNIYSSGDALSIGASPTQVIIIGKWDSGSIVRGSSNQLGYNWLNIKKPTTNPSDNIVVNCIAYSGSVAEEPSDPPPPPGIYIAGGAWYSITGGQYGALSSSSDGVNWSEAVFPDNLQNNANGDPGEGFTNGVAWSGVTTEYDPDDQSSPHSSFIAVGNWYNSLFPNLFRSSICRSVDGGRTWPVSLNPGPSPGTPGVGHGIVCFTGIGLSETMPGYWIAVGQWGNNTIAISDDVTGETWLDPPTNGGINFNPGGIGYGIAADTDGNKYIAVGRWSITEGGITKIITVIYGKKEDDEIIWTPVRDIQIPNSNQMINDNNAVGYGVSYRDGIFLVAGSWISGSTTYSALDIFIIFNSDGEEEIMLNLFGPTNENGSIISGVGRSISMNGNQMAIVGQWGNNTITLQSESGWIFPINPQGTLGTGNIATGILWNVNTLNWVACGTWFDRFNSNNANITNFTYGLSWFEPFEPPNSVNNLRYDSNPRSTVLWDPYRSQWVASGSWFLVDAISTSQISKSFITSSDGILWSTPFDYLNIITPLNLSLQVVPSGVLITGFWSAQATFFTTSSDGIIWSSPSTIPNVFSGNLYNIAWNGIRWVAVGAFNSVDGIILAGIIFSSDGIEWKAAINVTGIFYAVAWNGTIFLAFGTDTTGYFRSSSDGVNWSPPVNVSFVIKVTDVGLVWNGSFWIIGSRFMLGNNTASPVYLGSFSRSTDGINWTTPVDPVDIVLSNETLPNVYNIAYNGSMWIAVGSWITESTPPITYLMARSYNGIQWNVVPLVNISSLSSIKWNGSLWIAGGQSIIDTNFNIFTSYDGIIWIGQSNKFGQSTLQNITTLATKRILPYTGAQLFSPFIRNTSVETKSPVVPYVKDSAITWGNDPVYKNGTNYQTFLSSTNSPTFTFTATKRTQWLTFGTYYNLAPVTITLTLPPQTEVSLDVKSDLIGPHFSWTNSLGNALINSASLRIGGVLVDTIPGRLLEVLDEFQTPLERVNEVSNQTCRQLNGFNQSSFGTQTTGQIVRTPLPFWFSRGDPGCFLPIDALNVDEVRLTVNFNPITSLYYTDSRATNPDGSFIKTDIAGAGLWPMAGSSFYYQDSSGSLVSGLEPIEAPGQRFSAFPNVKMTTDLTMPESYLMVEYIYLDKPEANRFRIADIQVPIVQHYTFDPVDNQNNPYSRIPLVVPNPTRDLFFYCNRYEAQGYNATFLGTRDLSNSLIPGKLWWPDVSGLDNHYYGTIKSGFSTRYSEPIRWLSLDYSETLNRYTTENVGLFRSALPSLEQRKAPFVNRYYYNLPFGIQNGFTPFSMPIGEANLDKVLRMNLSLGFHGRTGNLTDDFVDRYNTYVFAETYNIFRVYGGRGGMMFAY
jgi:hypothetical protein